MKILFMLVGKNTDDWVESGMNKYMTRINQYAPVECAFVPEPRSLKGNQMPDRVKEMEGEALLARVKDSDFLVLLDERGKKFSSESFAAYIQRLMNRPIRRCIFAAGGAWGFSPGVFARANDRISLSDMTFNHQIIRVMFAEQLYRAFTILRGEPYHHGQ